MVTKPLRTAIIGLSSTAVTSWASATHLPALLTTNGRSKLPIAALLNSSVDAAKLAIKTYNLDPTTKAYGNPEDLANDADIDLVICVTRVDKHYETILPSIRAGKDVFVEWPIASNSADINTLVEEARKSGSRVAVGLQRRWAPPVVRLRELLKEGKLGKVLSSEVRIYGGTNDREILPEGLKYFAQRNIGGNPIVINYGHAFDFVLTTLGELDPNTVSTKLQLQRPSVRIRDPKTMEIVDTIRSDVPDLLSLHGALLPTAQNTKDATLSVLFRRGQPFPGTPPLTWTINCEYGEIRIVNNSSATLLTGANDMPLIFQVHWFEDDRVEDIGFAWSKEQEEVPAMGRDVQRTLFSFADAVGRGKGDVEKDGWVDLEDAAKRAAQIEGFLTGWEKSRS